MSTRLRQAVAADIPGIWEVRYAVTENTLTPGRISDEDVRAAIEDSWSRPPSARREMEVVLRIQLIPTGEVVSVSSQHA